MLSPPGQRVVWRGDRLPECPAALIDRIGGAARPKPAGRGRGKVIELGE
jgi:hypothetical protein